MKEFKGKACSDFASDAMPKLRRFHALLALCLVSAPAMASDFTGLFTMFIGLPAFIAFNVLMAVFLTLPANRTRKRVATALLMLVSLAGLIVSLDALALMRRDNADWWLGVAFFALVALAFFQHYKLLNK